MVGDPNRWANVIARLGGGRGGVPPGLSGPAADAGQAAHKAREDKAAVDRLINAKAPVDRAVEQFKQSRRGDRLALPPGFMPIPDDYETVATNALAPDGDISIAGFGKSIKAALAQLGLSADDRKRLESRLRVFEIYVGPKEDERYGKAAMVIGGVAAQGDAFTPRAPWVAFHALTEAVGANAPGASEALAKLLDDPELRFRCLQTSVRSLALQVIRPGTYLLVQPNNNISPVTYRFVFYLDGVTTGTIVKVDHILARGPLGFLTGMTWIQDQAMQMVEGTKFTGKWKLEVARPQRGGSTKRVLQLDLWQETPLGATADFNRDIEIVAHNSGVLYGYSRTTKRLGFCVRTCPSKLRRRRPTRRRRSLAGWPVFLRAKDLEQTERSDGSRGRPRRRDHSRRYRARGRTCQRG